MAEPTPLLPALRIVVSLVRHHLVPFSASVVGTLLFAAGTVGSAIVLGRVIDEVVVPEFETVSGSSPSSMWFGALAVLAVALVRAGGVVARRYFAGMTADATKRELQDRLGDKYVDLPMSWHHGMPTGRLLAHVDADVEVACHALHPLPFSLGVSSLAVFAAITAVLVDLPLAVVGFIVFPTMIAVNRFYNRYVEPPAARAQEAIGRVSATAHESFDGALIVKTLGRAEEESHRFQLAVEELRDERIHLGYIRSAFQSANEVLPQLGIVAVTLVGVYRLEADAITVGELVQMVALFSVLAFPMTVFGFFLENIPPAVVAHGRITEVLATPQPTTPTTPPATSEGAARLDARGLVAAYGDDPQVVCGVDLTAEPGETVAIVGSTGSGKSTLMSTLAGLHPVGSGSVRLDGVEVADLEPAARTSQIGYVSQDAFLFGDSIRDNIDLHHEHTLDEIRAAASIARADEFIMELPAGYDTVLGERGVTVSGGQRQRIALARAVLRTPRLLLLDDATSAVDSRVEQQILDRIEHDLDMTMVIVAQRLSTIQLADRVVYIRDGVVAAEGRHDELLGNDDYANLVTAYDRAGS